jgi:serine/threonine protein kinase
MNPSVASENTGRESLIGRLADEFADRLNRGEHPSVEEYAEAYPDLAEMIRRMLPAIEAMHSLSQSTLDGATYAADEGPASGTLGDFHIRREIGRGGMGVVYEAEQISLRRRVALKVLPFAAVLDPRRLQRFKNEAQAAACLHHGNIVPVYAVGAERGVHYYAMQYIEGQTLEQVIRRLAFQDQYKDVKSHEHAAPRKAEAAGEFDTQPLAPFSTSNSHNDKEWFRTVAELGEQAAQALEFAHSVGVVHRDIKPSNLILDAHGKLWITDFGLAQMENEAGLTVTGDVLGTLRYMSPEQARGESRNLDHRTDIYSLGATLFELLTLQPARPGENRQEVLQQIMEDAPPSLRRITPQIPAALETTVQKAMEKIPGERYSTAQELADDLRRFLEHKPIKARPPALSHRAAKWAYRNRVLVTAVAVVAAIAFVALIVTNLIVQAQYQEVVRQRASTEEKFNSVLGMMDLVNQALNEAARDVPQIQQVRTPLYRKLLTAYSELIHEDDPSPEVQLENARVLYLVAQLQNGLQNLVEQETTLRRSIAAYQRSLETMPNVEVKKELAKARLDRGRMLHLLATDEPVANALDYQKQIIARIEQAREEYAESVRLLEDLATRFPADTELQRQLRDARAATNQKPPDATDSSKSPREAIAAGGRPEENSDPKPLNYKEMTVLSMAERNLLKRQSTTLDEVRQISRRLIEREEQALAANPIARTNISGLASSYHSAAFALAERSAIDEAIQYYSLGDAVGERLIKEFPEQFSGGSASIYTPREQFAKLLSEHGRYSDELDLWRRTASQHELRITNWEKLAENKKPPGGVHIQLFSLRARIYENIAHLCLRLGKLDEEIAARSTALEQWEQLFGVLTGGLRIYTRENEVLETRKGAAEELAADAAWLLAASYRQAGQDSLALEYARRALEYYERACEVGGPPVWNATAWNLATCPHEELRNSKRSVEVAERAVSFIDKFAELSEGALGWRNTLGVACYRDGQFERAILILRDSVNVREGGDAFDWFFLAMANWRLANQDVARTWFDKAVAWMDQNAPDNEELIRFRAEAEELLGVTDSADHADSPRAAPVRPPVVPPEPEGGAGASPQPVSEAPA